jgi:hypothetical protein
MGRKLKTYGGEQAKEFDGERYFFDSVAEKKSCAKQGAEHLRANGHKVRIVPITAKGSRYKYRLYKVGKN